jgi:hypothetical protein
VYLLSDTKLAFVQRISTQSSVWDFGFEPQTGHLVLLTSGDNFLRRFELSQDALSEVEDNQTEPSKADLERFFEGDPCSSTVKAMSSCLERLTLS